jgi:hypothetical protein
MQLTVIALIFGAAIIAWLMLMSGSHANANAAVAERFSVETKPDESAKKNSYSSDIMDIYKEMYGKYPLTEVLVSYRDSAVSQNLTLEEIKSRIKNDGGKPPGLVVPSEKAEAAVAAAESKAGAFVSPPKPGDAPPVPGAAPGASMLDLPGKLMAIAVQISSLSEQIKASATNMETPQVPKGFESFIQF